MGRFLKYGLPVFAGLFLVALGAPAVWAHGGGGVEEQRCRIDIGKYRVFYAGYRQGNNGGRLSANFQQFCEHIPSVGETLLVFDLKDEVLRNLPVELRIVRGDDSAADSQTLAHLPPQVYPQGSMEVAVNFDKLGPYIGTLTAGAEEKITADFPLLVEEAHSGGGNWVMYGLIILGLVGGGGALLFVRGRGKNKTSTT